MDSQSAFDSSLPGIAMIGYGTTDITNSDGTVTSGVPKNAYTLLTKISEALNDSGLSGTDLMSAIDPYLTSLKNTQGDLESQQTKVGIGLNMLSSTGTYLQNTELNLDDRDNEVEYIDITDAVTDYYMQQYCYKASLQVGSQTIQQSLMDYLK